MNCPPADSIQEFNLYAQVEHLLTRNKTLERQVKALEKRIELLANTGLIFESRWLRNK